MVDDCLLITDDQSGSEDGIGHVCDGNGRSRLEIRRRTGESGGRDGGVDWIGVAEDTFVLGTRRKIRKCPDGQLNLFIFLCLIRKIETCRQWRCEQIKANRAISLFVAAVALIKKSGSRSVRTRERRQDLVHQQQQHRQQNKGKR